MVDKVNYSVIKMLQYVMKSRCANLMVDKVNFSGAVHFSMCQFDEAAVTYNLHYLLSVWNCDTEFCEWNSNYQVRLNLRV